MTHTGKLRVYIATSVDGFIAGTGDDLSWLPGMDAQAGSEPAQERDGPALTFDAFLAQLGAVLMGRRTFDVVAGFAGDWLYGELPMRIATHRQLECDKPQVRAVHGEIKELVSEALDAAGGKDVYIDGGNLIRQALDAGLVDDMVVTLAPVVLGRGIPLFAGCAQRHQFETLGHCAFPGGMVQWHLRPVSGPR